MNTIFTGEIQIYPSGKLQLPALVRKKLKLDKNSILSIVLDKENNVILKKMNAEKDEKNGKAA